MFEKWKQISKLWFDSQVEGAVRLQYWIISLKITPVEQPQRVILHCWTHLIKTSETFMHEYWAQGNLHLCVLRMEPQILADGRYCYKHSVCYCIYIQKSICNALDPNTIRDKLNGFSSASTCRLFLQLKVITRLSALQPLHMFMHKLICCVFWGLLLEWKAFWLCCLLVTHRPGGGWMFCLLSVFVL